MFRGNRFEQGAKDLRFHQSRQQPAEDFRRRLFVDVIFVLSRMVGGGGFGFSIPGNRQKLLDHNALIQDRLEFGEDQENLVELVVLGKEFDDVVRHVQRFGEFNAAFAGQPDVLADDLPAPAKKIAPLAADGQQFDFFFVVLLEKGRRRFQQISIEGAA